MRVEEVLMSVWLGVPLALLLLLDDNSICLDDSGAKSSDNIQVVQ